MSSKKSELFHAHESDALRLIKRAQAAGEETDAKPNVEILKPPPELTKRRKAGGRPKKAEKDKSRRTKQISLYLSPEEYEFLKEYARSERYSISNLIVNSALKHLDYKPNEDK